MGMFNDVYTLQGTRKAFFRPLKVRGTRLSKKSIFRAFFVNKFILTCLTRCQNIFNQLCVLDRIPADHYKQFFVFEPTHWGLTVVICGADLTEILNFRAFLANESIQTCLIRPQNVINRLSALHGIPPDHYQQFSDLETTHRGLAGVICGTNLTQKLNIRAFLVYKSIGTCLNRCQNTIN